SLQFPSFAVRGLSGVWRVGGALGRGPAAARARNFNLSRNYSSQRSRPWGGRPRDRALPRVPAAVVRPRLRAQAARGVRGRRRAAAVAGGRLGLGGRRSLRGRRALLGRRGRRRGRSRLARALVRGGGVGTGLAELAALAEAERLGGARSLLARLGDRGLGGGLRLGVAPLDRRLERVEPVDQAPHLPQEAVQGARGVSGLLERLQAH